MVAAGARHACALETGGRVSCWGWNVDGETGTGSAGIEAAFIPVPTAVATERRFLSVSAGSGFTCGVDVDSGTWCWGSNIDGILGASAPERCGDAHPVPCSSRPVRIPIEPAVQVSAGTGHVCALTRSNSVICWGRNESGQLGFLGDQQIVREPRSVTLPESERIALVSSGGLKTCAITEQHRLWCWGSDLVNLGGKVSHPADYAPRPVGGDLRFQSMSVGSAHLCATSRSGHLYCWGDTIQGALGGR
jgi:alpha-tubulin suppressor-like RCC1 family protein